MAREWKRPFLAALRNSGNVRASCQAAGIERKTAYRNREKSAEFRAQWDEALEEAVELLEAEARRRAMGESDTLLIFLLKSHKPKVYREPPQRLQLGQDPDSGPITLKVVYDQ